ncbi:MAG: PatB family C-S lyase [Cardiobacteriaceae bacterium]|nr:PatB family C-S lyase [Cardiobacteriaceae bacterium]
MLHSSDNRVQSDSEKWRRYAGTSILPMWVADTEFLAAKLIQDALQARIEHGVFGYGHLQTRFINGIIKHCKKQYNWEVDPEWILALPGVVPGLNFSRAITRLRGKKEAVTVEPVYPHLRKHPALIPDFVNRGSPCILENNRWKPDFAALEASINADTGLLLLCHPHNPIGRAYEADELARYADIAKKHDLIVCSDEIHCDLILNNKVHRPFASLSADTLQRTITLMAMSKTYNIAGLCCAFAIIANSDLRNDFRRVSAGLTDINILGMTASIAALEQGEPWRQQMIAYLKENGKLVEQRINATGILKTTNIEATFLAWIDARELKVDNPKQFFETHGVGMNDGADFGAPGFVRLNFGCPREMLEEALNRIERALEKR